MSCSAAAGRVRVQLATAGLEGLAAVSSAPAISGGTSVPLAGASHPRQAATG
ncbi:Mitotic spindle checkpoint component MAD2 [Giardia duodenalis]|uniref:Mitotic spindle checkpoint component MAD2 n=1 Tax=Giardia intestinalis TaxID=5741 RepID=V6TZY8_GIAIN|nr:Mitotic spindle checkpoint component MAD2 [Giardia intestinalis]